MLQLSRAGQRSEGGLDSQAREAGSSAGKSADEDLCRRTGLQARTAGDWGLTPKGGRETRQSSSEWLAQDDSLV